MREQLALVPSSLDECAEKANREHALCRNTFGLMVQHAIAAGLALIDAKAQLRHGDWLPWLAENFEGSERIARLYMQVAENRQRVADLDSLRDALKLLASGTDKPHVAENSGNNEWYTPEPYIEAAKAVLGGIDLDPASSDEANAIVGAESYFTSEDDGLDRDWEGRLWMNPPYATGLVEKFTAKLAASYEAGSVQAAITLVNNATDTQWFHGLARRASAICFPEGRVRFLSPEGEKGAPLQGQAILYLGRDVDAFVGEFARFGLIVEVRRA